MDKKGTDGVKKIKDKAFSEVKMDPKDKAIYKYVLRGWIYFCSILIVWGMGKRLLAYPIEMAINYKLDVNKVAELVFEDYNITITVILLIAIFAIPLYDILLKLKKLGKENLEFYNDSEPVVERISKTDTQEVAKEICNIIKSDDKILDDEEYEKELINKNSKEDQKNIMDMKADNIIEYINPITQQILMILYYNKINISETNIIGILNSKRTYKKLNSETKKNLANAIITFLENNDIIESDEMEDRYYFTNFAKTVMNAIGRIK